MNHSDVTRSQANFPFGAPSAHTYIDYLIRICVSFAIFHLHALLVDFVFLARFWVFFAVIPLDHILQIIDFLIT